MRACTVLVLPLAALLGLAGCAETTTPVSTGIPSNAVNVAQGTGKVGYLTGMSGMLYVYDTTNSQTVYTGPVQRNQVVQLDPDSNKVTIAGRTAVERTINATDNYMLYIVPSSTAGTGTSMEQQGMRMSSNY